MTIHKLAKQALQFFIRENNTWHMKEDRPDWVYEMVKIAHGNYLPDDFKYEFIVETLFTLSENTEMEIDDLLDQIEGDIYNSDLLKWVSSNLERADYINEAQESFSLKQDTDFYDRIRCGQILEKQEVSQMIFHHLEELVYNEDV